MSSICIACRTNTFYVILSFSLLPYLSAVRRTERGTALDESRVDLPLAAGTSSIGHDIQKEQLIFAHKLEHFLQHIVKACSSPGQSSLRELDRAGPEVITKLPILRDRSSCLNIELVDREDTKLVS